MKTRNVVLLVIVGVVLLLVVLSLIALRLAIPDLSTARMAASEVAAVHEIRSIHSAQMQYMSGFGKYATTLAELGAPDEKNGYLFTLTATPDGYTISARPRVYNGTGRRTFYSDQSLIIHQNRTQVPADANSPELK